MRVCLLFFLPRKIPARSIVVLARSSPACLTLVLFAATAFAQSGGDNVRVRVAMNPEGSETIYQTDPGKTANDRDGNGRGRQAASENHLSAQSGRPSPNERGLLARRRIALQDALRIRWGQPAGERDATGKRRCGAEQDRLTAKIQAGGRPATRFTTAQGDC